MKALYLVSSKKEHSWAKVREGKTELHFINLSFVDKIRLYFSCCPNKALAKMYEKGAEMLD